MTPNKLPPLPELLQLADEMDDQANRWSLESGEYAQGRCNSFCEAAAAVRERALALRQSQSLPAGAVAAWLYEYPHDGETDHSLSVRRSLPSWVAHKGATETPLYAALQADAREKGAAVAWQWRFLDGGHWVDCGPEAFQRMSHVKGYEVRALYATQPAQASENVITVCGTCYGKGYVMDGNGNAMTREPCPNCVPVATHPQPVTPADSFTRYAHKVEGTYISWRVFPEPHADGEWCKFSEVRQALLGMALANPVTPAGGEVYLIEPENVADESLPLIQLFGGVTIDGKTLYHRTIGAPWPFHPPVADAALVDKLNALADEWERAANVMKVAGNIRRYPEDYIGELRAAVKDAALNQRGGG